jgi:hypothetical protein
MLDYTNGQRTVSNEMVQTLVAEHYYASEWPSAAELANPKREEALAGLDAYIEYIRLGRGLKWQLWACYADKPDLLVEVFDKESEALFVCNEMNIAASDFHSPADYRVCIV